jgi:hypothetical protein
MKLTIAMLTLAGFGLFAAQTTPPAPKQAPQGQQAPAPKSEKKEQPKQGEKAPAPVPPKK